MLTRSTSSRCCISTRETPSSWEEKATLKALPNADLLRNLQTPASGKFHIWRCEKARLLFVREVCLTQTKFLHVLQDVKLHSCHYSQHTCFQKITLYRSNFSDGYISHNAMSSSCTAFYGETRHVICVIVCLKTTTLSPGNGYGPLTSDFSIAFRLTSSGHSRDPLCPTRYSVCVLTLWDYVIVGAWRRGFRYEVDFVVSAWRECSTLSAYYGKISCSGWTRYILRLRIEVKNRFHSLPGHRNPIYFLMWGFLKDYV